MYLNVMRERDKGMRGVIGIHSGKERVGVTK